MDVDSIEPGADFGVVLAQAVGACHVLLALIGPHWLTATNEAGLPRLDDPNDIVRMEIETAIRRRVRIIPVLIDGADIPDSKNLPDSLVSLARRNAFRMRHETFRHDAQRLLSVIEELVEAPQHTVSKPEASESRRSGNTPEGSTSKSTSSELDPDKEWAVELLQSSSSVRHLRLQLTHETHFIEVVHTRDTVEVTMDGKVVYKGGGPYAEFLISDGAKKYKARCDTSTTLWRAFMAGVTGSMKGFRLSVDDVEVYRD